MFHNEMEYCSKWIRFQTVLPLDEFLVDFCQHEFYVWDSDNCGSEHIQFVIEDLDTGVTSYHEIYHYWGWEDDKEEGGYSLINEFSYEKVDSVKFSYPSVDRDYLTLLSKWEIQKVIDNCAKKES